MAISLAVCWSVATIFNLIAILACEFNFIDASKINFAIDIYNITKIINPIILTTVRLKNPVVSGHIK